MKAEKEGLRTEKTPETSQNAQSKDSAAAAGVSAEEAKNKKLNKAIKILIILLLLSVLALLGRCAYLEHRASVPATVIVPDNIVGDDVNGGNNGNADSDKTNQNHDQLNSNTSNSGSSASGNFGVSKNNTGTSGGSSDTNAGNTEKDKNNNGKQDGSSDNSGGNKNDQNDQNGGNSGTDDPNKDPDNNGTDDPGKDNPGTDKPGKDDSGKDNPGTGGGSSGGTSAPVLQFYKGNDEWNQKFQAENLFPGDHVKKYYCIEIYHERPTTVYFKAKITSDKAEKYLAMNPLQDNLKLKVTRISEIPEGSSQTKEILCDAVFSKVDDQEYATTFQVAANSPTIAYYCIEAYLDTSVGNDCMSKTLTADFQW